MRPYLAIIKDSFREALASRVLWILMGLASLFLLALAPVSLNEKSGAYLQPGDVTDPEALVLEVLEEKDTDGSTPGGQIWRRLDPDVRNELQRVSLAADDPEYPIWTLIQFPTHLSGVLSDPTLYDEAAWAGITLSAETQSLVEQDADELSAEQVARRNRLLLQDAYPDLIRPTSHKDLYPGYLGSEMSTPLQVTKDQVIERALEFFTDGLLGVVGVFIAVLVTASIIPKTFERGVVDLLLSKPIARPLLFLSKFCGGCAFICVVSGYVVVGCWVIFGLRFSYWNHRLLWCIPLLLFLFAIYYSISAVVGLVWRNTVMAIILTVLFWCMCFGTGATKSLFETFVMNPERIDRLVPAGEELIAVRGGGALDRWDADGQGWQSVDTTGSSPMVMGGFMLPASSVGPVYDPVEKRLLRIGMSPDAFTMDGSGQVLFEAKSEDGWLSEPGPEAPTGPVALFVRRDGQVLVVAAAGLFLFDGTVEAKPRRHVSILGIPVKWPFGSSTPFRSIGPDDGPRPTRAAMDTKSERIALFAPGQLTIIAPQPADGRYVIERQAKVDQDQSVALAFAGSRVVCGDASGRLVVYDAESLERLDESQPEGRNGVGQLRASPAGRWIAARFQHGWLWLYDTSDDQWRRPRVNDQGHISAVAFAGEDHLLLAHAFNHVSEYELDARAAGRKFHPALHTAETIYWYAVMPIYTVFPKPGQLGNMVTYLVTGKETVDPGIGNVPAQQIDVWGPLWSNLVFMVIVLALGSLYIYRKDF